MDGTIHDKLDAARDDIQALTFAVGAMVRTNEMLGQRLVQLIEILAPAEKSDAGQSMAAALARLADEVEQQNRSMAELNGVIVQYVRDMPKLITESVLGGTRGLLTAIQDLPGRVMVAVRDALR